MTEFVSVVRRGTLFLKVEASQLPSYFLRRPRIMSFCRPRKQSSNPSSGRNHTVETNGCGRFAVWSWRKFKY